MSEPTFDKNGQYDLRTPSKRAAAMKHALRMISIVPQAYHSRSRTLQIAEMQRIATELLQQITKAEQLERESLAKTMRKMSGVDR